MNRTERRLSVVALSACAVGAAVCPVPYLATAIPSGLRLFPILRVVVVVLGVLTLLLRFLRKPGPRRLTRVSAWPIELVSWMAIGYPTLEFIRIPLTTDLQRWGTLSRVFLTASLLCFPIVWMRATALEQRLLRLPRGVLVVALVVVLAVPIAVAIGYLTIHDRIA